MRKDGEIHQSFRWVNEIAYVDSERREHSLSVVECLNSRRGDGQEVKTAKFKRVTNVTLDANNIVALANEGGRLRWKIENEGFNVQKNGGYHLEHAYQE